MIQDKLSMNVDQSDSFADKIIHQDLSTLSHYLQKWWNYVAILVPNTVSPNAITFAGGFAMVLSAIVALISSSPWMCLFHAMCIFIFQTLDAIDGIHARRLCMASKLGNYIDHATDIVTIQIMFHVLFYVVGLDGYYLILTTLFINFNIFLTHWETANTGVLYFPDGFSITELQWLCIALHLITFMFPGLWATEIIGMALSNLLSIVIVLSNLIFLTVPLVKRVMKKNKDQTVEHLSTVIALTICLFFWTVDLEIEKIYLVLHLNLPYSVMIGSYLFWYLGLSDNPRPDFGLPCLYLIILILGKLCFMFGQSANAWSAIFFFFITCEIYALHIRKISEKLGTSVFEMRNLKKKE